jgi:hypothetical protein
MHRVVASVLGSLQATMVDQETVGAAARQSVKFLGRSKLTVDRQVSNSPWYQCIFSYKDGSVIFASVDGEDDFCGAEGVRVLLPEVASSCQAS